MSGSITGVPSIIGNASMMSYGFSWSGASPVGAVSIQVSNDYKISPDGRTVLNAGTWNTLTFLSAGSQVSSFAVSGNSGNGFVDIFQTGAYAIRPVYTRTSGTGTLQAVFNGKAA